MLISRQSAKSRSWLQNLSSEGGQGFPLCVSKSGSRTKSQVATSLLQVWSDAQFSLCRRINVGEARWWTLSPMAVGWFHSLMTQSLRGKIMTPASATKKSPVKSLSRAGAQIFNDTQVQNILKRPFSCAWENKNERKHEKQNEMGVIFSFETLSLLLCQIAISQTKLFGSKWFDQPQWAVGRIIENWIGCQLLPGQQKETI